MKTLRSTVQICLLFLCVLLISAGLASASTVTLSGNILFSSLDGSAQDSDNLADGVFTVNGDVVVAGTINCNDDPPLSGNASACPIRIAVTGDLTMQAGSGIFAENRRNGGHGGDIRLDVGGDLALQGPGGGLSGAVVSSSRLGDGNSWRAGNITISVGGGVELQASSAISASTLGGSAGTIAITAEGTIQAAGLIASGPSRTVLPSRWTGLVLGGGANGQIGGSISLRSHTSAEPAIRINSGGVVASQGEDSGGRLVLLEGCGIEVRGLVASVSKQGGPSLVAIRSGKGILVDGRDLGTVGSRLGRIRADGSLGGAAGYLVDLFAASDIQVLGPDPSSTAPYTVSSSPGSQAQRPAGGTITAISLSGSLTATGKAFEAGRLQDGNKGGTIDLKARNEVSLDGASLAAVGGFTSSSKNRTGGRIFARSYQGEVSWTFGVGDVRPTGTGVPVANRGQIILTACTTVDITGTQFPVTGSAVPPFPVENVGVCSPAAPQLPAGEPPLSACNEPPVANAQTVETDEDTPLTITLTGSDPNSDPLTFSIVTPPAYGSLGPLTSPTATSVQVAYTPNLNYNGSDSFTFQVDDGHGGTDTATVTITIHAENDAPQADDDAYDVDEGETLNVSAPGVLDGDADPESDTLTAVIDNGPLHASSFILSADGSFTYVHDGSETTSDSFTYHANDGSSNSNVASVTITINAGNDAPVADDDGPYAVNEGSTLNVPAASGVLNGDTDPEDSVLTANLVTGPAHASSFALNGDGSFTYVHDGSETTSDSFTYKANDGTSDSNVATVAIVINPVNDPPAANPDAADITEEAPNMAAANTVSGSVLTNDTDPDSSLTVSAVAGGSVGSLRVGTYGSVTINSNGSFTYALDDTNPAVNALAPGGVLVDAFGYTAYDGALTSSSTLTVTIHGADDPATPDNDAHEFIGNTELRVDLDASDTPTTLATTPSTSGVLDGDIDPEGGAIVISTIVGCADVTAPFDCVLPGEGAVSLQSTGRFTFVPEPGDTDLTASFQYTLAGNPAPATVTLTRKERVWYVKNDDGGGTGVSSDPFATLAEAQAASVAGDTLYIFEGDGEATGYDQGIVLKSNQRLIGEGVQLDVPVSVNGGPNPTVLRNAGDRPDVDNTNAGGHAVSATDAIPARIAGLNLMGSGNAIDITTNGAFSGSGSLTIANNTIDNTGRPSGAEGIDINAGGTGTLTLAVHDNSLASTGTGIDIQKTGAGTLTITAFDDNVVSGSTGGSGIIVSNALFDSVPGGGLNTVDAGTTVIGVLGNGVGGAGVALGNVQGDLHFTGNLNIFADGGAGLTVSGTGAGFQIRVNSGGAPTGIIEATGGPAVDASAAALDLRLTSLRSTNSTSTGVSLTNVTGTFSGESGSTITNATGTDFAISGGTAAVTYKGTITDDVGQLVSVSGATAGTKSFEGAITDGDDGDSGGVSLSGNTGATVRFSGGLTLSTGSNPAFAATGGGTLEICDENPCNGAATGALINKITTTTSTALNVANTMIGGNNLEFRSISAGTAAGSGGNGITLDNTGTAVGNGGLVVRGTGTAGSGGTIQHKTGADGSTASGIGIYLNQTKAASFNRMQLNDFDNFAIRANEVVGLTLSDIVVSGLNGNSAAADEGSIFVEDSGGTIAVSNTNVSGGFEDNLRVHYDNGTAGPAAVFNVAGSTFRDLQAAGNNSLVNLRSATSASSGWDVDFNFTGSCVFENDANTLPLGGTENFADGMLITFEGPFPHSLNVQNGTFHHLFQAMDIASNFSADVSYVLKDNTITFTEGVAAIALGSGSSSTNQSFLTGLIQGNTIGTSGVAQSGNRLGLGIALDMRGEETAQFTVHGNTIRRTEVNGIQVIGQTAADGNLDVQITNNTIAEIEDNGGGGAGVIYGIEVTTNNSSSHDICLDARGNDSFNINAQDIRVRQSNAAVTFAIEGLTGSGASDVNVENYLVSQNPGNTADVRTGGSIVNYTSVANCATPPTQ